MDMPKVFVDFHNSDVQGHVRLNTTGSIEDLNRSGIILTPGLKLRLYCDELEADGEVVLSEEGIWAARIDWNAVRRR